MTTLLDTRPSEWTRVTRRGHWPSEQTPALCVNLNSQPLRLFVERSPITSNGTAGSGSEPYGAAVHLDRVTSPRDQPAEYAVDPLVGPLQDRHPGSLPGCGKARAGALLMRPPGRLPGSRRSRGVPAGRRGQAGR